MEFIEEWKNIQFFSEQSIEAIHAHFKKMIKRITDRDDFIKAKSVMTWLFERNMVNDIIGVDKVAEIFPMSFKQREKFTRKQEEGKNTKEG